MKVKTSELTGAALDWAVAKALGHPPADLDPMAFISNRNAAGMHCYSERWEQGGPIIEREKMWLSDEDGEWIASSPPHVNVDTGRDLIHYGPTPLVAVMRCYVASKFGDEVDIPEEIS